MESVKQQFPKLLSGLGKLEGEYEILLKPDTKKFALSMPRYVSLLLLRNDKQELAYIGELGVISKVEQPTDCCVGMVLVPKPDDTEVHMCVGQTKLNDPVKREAFVLPSMEHTLGQLEGTKAFGKLDANPGFRQISLSNESALFTTFISLSISSAPQYFHRMSELREGLDSIVCRMDDVLVTSRCDAEN